MAAADENLEFSDESLECRRNIRAVLFYGLCEYGDFRTEGPNSRAWLSRLPGHLVTRSRMKSSFVGKMQRKNAVEITGMEEDEVHGQFRIAAVFVHRIQ